MYLKNVIKGYKEKPILESVDEIFKHNKFFQLIYTVDQAYKQTSPVIFKRRKTEKTLTVIKATISIK